VHYYSPIPDTRTLAPELWERPSELVGIDLNAAAQLKLLREEFPKYRLEYSDFAAKRTSVPYEFHFNNGVFDGTDALVLHCMIRHFRPARIIEIGSGYSSRVAARAALINGGTSLTCIDSYPTEVMRRGFPGLDRLIIEDVQQVGFETFAGLNDGDVLFIDSAHVIRTGGDVQYLYLEVLPRLAPGVIVHIHDIFLPFNYPRTWLLDEVRFWNEQYLLQAFLTFNPEFELLLSNHYLGTYHEDVLREVFPDSPWHGGCSFWMRRKSS
jgi:predicted O-methyltransferase YrrM